MNEILSVLFFSSFVLPAVAAGLSWPEGRMRRMVPRLLLVSLALGLAIAGRCLLGRDTVGLDYSSHLPFAFGFVIDKLSGFFLLLICGVGAAVVLFSSSYAEHYSPVSWKWYWCLVPFFILSMIVVVAASTIFTFMLGWELMTLISAGLILIEGDSEERKRSLFIYLVMMHAGAAAVFAAFLLFAPYAPALTLEGMRTASATLPGRVRVAIFLLSLIGFGTKAGIVPLHFWLPKAHGIAPNPVSALMSAVMLKTAIYGFLRLVFDVLGTPQAWWGYLVLGAGIVTALLGILYALAEHTLKRLLAYSSIENIGLIYVGLGLALVFEARGFAILAALALIAALFHALNHAVFKSLLFLGSGAVYQSTNTLNMEELGGLLSRMPRIGISFLIGCAAIAGLPLLNGFVSEWLIFRSLLNGSALGTVPVLPLLIGAVALASTLACACFVKLFGITFLGRPRSVAAREPHSVPVNIDLSLLALSAVCVLLGVFPGLALNPLYALVAALVPNASIPPEIPSISQMMPVVSAGVCVLVILVSVMRKLKSRPVDTWACGLSGLTERMQYTGTSFSKPLRSVFAAVYRPTRTLDVAPANEPYFPSSISYRSVRTTSFEKTLYRPTVDLVVAAARQLRRLHTGNIQTYLLYIFLMILGLLVVLRFA